MIIRNTLLGSAATLSLLFCATQAQAQAQAPAAPRPPAVAPDARTALSSGLHDAGIAASNLALESTVAAPPGFFDPEALFAPPTTREEAEAMQARFRDNPPKYGPLALANSDMAMANGKLFVGNFHGFNAYDVTRGGAPELVLSVVCPGGQGDLSIHGNLLFMSVEQNRARLDCGVKDATGEVNAERFRGIRIFDISDLSAPRQIAAVQTCRGSHTHTLLPSGDPNVLYIYNSATSGVRKSDELSICSDGLPTANPETALYSIDVIKVPLNAPETAAIVARPRIFTDAATGAIAGLWKGGRAGVSSQRTADTDHCHDITVYPEMNLAAGACSGNGILLDITNPEAPTRVSDIFDPDMAYWHSATFNNTADKIVFTDEWGGGTSPRCRAEDPANWGANLIAAVKPDRTLEGQNFYKLPGIQTARENCVAHNGNLIPVPGRDLMIQAWYQGGVSIMDFTDPNRPTEIAYFDRGPIDPVKMVVGGAWSAYWMNGRIYSSEIARGLDVLKLVPSQHLSAAEIAVAESVMAETINPQTQTRNVWVDSPDVATAYLDQLTRTSAVDAEMATQIRAQIDPWRAGSPDARGAGRLARTLTAASEKATGADQMRMKALAEVFERMGG